MNTGIEKAREAALAVDGFVAVPELDGRKCDFNDLHREKGPEAVRQAIEAAFRPDAARDRSVALSIDELLIRDFPPMEPLLDPWLCKQHIGMVHSWRGIGKTHFLLGVAYAVAGGGTFLKWKAEKPRRVVYIDGEMAGAAIKARIAAIVESTPDENEPPEGYFLIITPDAQHLPLPDLSSLEGQAALAPHIADADLIVVDNLSSLMRSGAENDAESWVPVADWALALRRQGKAVLFAHHDGKGKTQRGTSKKEDLMDVVIKLDHTKDYEPGNGAAFTVEFEKARHLSGEDARNLEVALIKDEEGRQAWAWKVAEQAMAERVLALHAEAPDMNQTEIAAELGCNRSTVSRALKSFKRGWWGAAMSRLKRLLHVAGPSTGNTQQTTVQACSGVAQHAHTAQQRLLHVAGPSPCNTQQGGALPDPAAEAELRRLVNMVADAHGFNPEDRREALENALRDRENALTCFRLLGKDCDSLVH